MKNSIFLFLLIFQLNNLNAQRVKSKTPNFQLGIRTGNHITLPNIDSEKSFIHKPLLRYSAGLLFRKTILQMKPRRRVGFGTARHGIIALDFGLNAVFSGYHYNIGELHSTTEQMSWELPVMMVIYDKKNFFIPQTWRRRGLTTYGRFGPKASFSFVDNISKTIRKDPELVIENINSGGWNFIWSLNAGIIQNRKSGNTTFVEIGLNQGFLPGIIGELSYHNQGNVSESSFSFRGSYFSINVGFLFDPKNWKYIPIGKGELPKTIFNPRFI